MNNLPRKKSTAEKITRIILKSILFLLLFVVLVFLLLLTPPVQRYITGRVEHYLTNKLHTKVEIARISFGLNGRISLRGVYIEDHQKDTLLSGGAIKARLNILKIFSNNFKIRDLELDDITAKVRRELPDTIFNYQFIIDAFTSPSNPNDTSASRPTQVDLSNVRLKNVHLIYNDVLAGNEIDTRIGDAMATFTHFDPYGMIYAVPGIALHDFHARIRVAKPLSAPQPVIIKDSSGVPKAVLKFIAGQIDLDGIDLQYDNEMDESHADIHLGELKVIAKQTGISEQIMDLDELILKNSRINYFIKNKPMPAEKLLTSNAVANKGWNIHVKKIDLENDDLGYNDYNLPILSHGIDYNHLQADSLNLQAYDLVISNDTISAQVLHGSVNERSGFVLNELQGKILYTNHEIAARDLYIKTPGSEIKKTIRLQYASPDDLAEHFEKTIMQAELVNSHIQVKDILAFAPMLRSQQAFSNPQTVWNINLNGKGTLNDLDIANLQFSGLYNTRINASGTLSGLVSGNIGGNFYITNLHTTQKDLALFTGQSLSAENINLPEQIDVYGRLSGNAGQLDANLNISSTEGAVTVNGRFSNIGDINAATYDATLHTKGLNLGSILKQQDMVGPVNGDFTFKGKGFSKNAALAFTGKIAQLEYNRYNYHNIALDGNIQDQVFNVKTNIKDPNADLDLALTGSMSGNSSFKIAGMVDSLKTLPLHLTTKHLIARGKIDGTITSITKDNVYGSVLITKALFVSGKDRLPLDTVELVNTFSDTSNHTRLRSDIANISIDGQYSITTLGDIITNSVQPYFTTTARAKAPYSYHFTITADAGYSAVVSALVPGLGTYEPIHAVGSFSSVTGMNFTLTTDHLVYQGNDFEKLNLVANSNSELQIHGTAARVKSVSGFDVYNARINAVAANNQLRFSVGTDDQFSRNKYYLAGLITQPTNGTYVINLNRDSLLLNYETWSISPSNKLTVTPSSITASDFTLQRGNQQLSLNGNDGTLHAQFSQFRLATITGFTRTDSLPADGLINGELVLTDVLRSPAFSGDLLINDFSMQHDTIGNVNLKVKQESSNRYLTNMTITGRGNDITASGYLTSSRGDLLVDLDMNIKAMQLNTLQGALASVLSNASGSMTGNIKVNGSIMKPNIEGVMNFDNASFTPALLGSRFRVEKEKLLISNDGIVFDHFTVKDSLGNTLDINGTAATKNFNSYNYDLDIVAKNFQVMNTPKARGKMYYGSLNVDARLHVQGTELKPFADGTITVNQGTNFTFVVPQVEPGVAQREGVVEFVDMKAPENDSLFNAYDSLNNSGIRGIDIAANIAIKKEAVFNIVVDEANGDFLNVQGEAQLSAAMDPSGKMTLAGNYTLDQGSYQLTYNFIQRKFDIQKGSTILWTGEPTTANLDVKAMYIARTAPLDLVADQLSADANRNYYLQKLPFEVHLNLTGELLKPVVDFDIDLPEGSYGVSNDIVTAVQSRLNTLREDKGEINKQVFSLLLLNRFVGENPFSSSASTFNFNTYARESVSKLLTEQLNQVAADMINGVDINFDVVSTDDYTTGSRMNRTDLSVGLSKRLLNNRLKITVGSNFQLEGPQNSNQQNNNIAGNVAVDYQISKDGRYVIRFYRQNEYEGIVDGYIIETGMRFIFSVDYNRFMQIFRKRKPKTSPAQPDNKTTL